MQALKLNELGITLPFFNTSIPAGFPTPALDYEEEEIDLSRILQPNPASSFIIRVKGDSMTEANIPDGCMAVVDRSIRPSTGDIIVASLDGEYTVKRLVKAGRSWVLHPENPFYKPIVITEEAEFQVWGVVTAVIVDMRK
ncbi:LexA family protein [Chitinophaga arvensicola]|uniref:SOS response UmuD protein. Serine peptidase. MEROPS family S24 n=1 Tax=Chitinophaga arvensicola TaxID=29529 RepID=A0A1I0SEQ2_9BACT|nr:translesion error-prone DNA polymerase V autoproteolytic subunit [Chitinophaga arvensicola]SEW54949.1 SOS response UmuD protein. Serine peptidase. MEROPS family S24 [Chitinophaga arvensicola]